MILIIVAVLLAAMMSGCLNQGTDQETDSGSPGGFSSSLNENENAEDDKTEDTDAGSSGSGGGGGENAAGSSSFPDVVVATGSGGGGGSSKPNIWLASVSNPFIGTWISEDEDGSVLTYIGYSDGTFDYTMENLPSEYVGVIPDEGSGAYIVRKDLDGVHVAVSYFDFGGNGMIKSNKFEVITNDLIRVTEFTLTDEEQKEYGESTYFKRVGTANRDDYVDTVLPENIFSMYSDPETGGYGWGAGLPVQGSVWKFKEDGSIDLIFRIDIPGIGETECMFPFSYVIYDDENDNYDRLIVYGDTDEGNEMFVLEATFDEEDSSMILEIYPVDEYGFAMVKYPDVEFLFWPYPTVNPKIIEKGNNEAGMFFLSVPDINEWAAQVNTAEDNGFYWAHEVIDPENADTYTKNVSGKPNQISAGDFYASGFEFSLATTADIGDTIRPAMGFNAFFDFTRINFDFYDQFAAELKGRELQGELMYYEGWYLPAEEGSAVMVDMLTDYGISVYSDVGGTPTDITDRFAFGISYDEQNDMMLLSYGAVMVDSDDTTMSGIPLPVSAEDELIWSDRTKDNKITGEWWIVYDSTVTPFADGSGTVADPYQIETADQLDRVRYHLDGNFILIDDINLSGYSNWEPLGTFIPASEEDEENPIIKRAFTGTFNGDGYSISDVSVNSEDIAVGLFGCVVGSTKAITIEGMNCPNCIRFVTEALYEVDGVKFVNIDLVPGGQSTATVVLSQDIDYTGLDALLTDAVDNAHHYTTISITGSTSAEPSIYDLVVEDVDVSGSSMLVGGVIGYAAYCVLEEIILTENGGTNTITGNSMVGGIVGGGFADLTDCSATADIIVIGDGGSMAGILAGGMEESMLSGCYASGTITASGDSIQGLGGLAGCAFESALVEDCLAEDVTITATGSGNILIGGLLGMTGTTDGSIPTSILNCDIDNVEIIVSDTSSRIGGIVGGGFALTEEMLDAMLGLDEDLSAEERAVYYEMFEEYFTPSVFEITSCDASGSITGGFEYVGSIAGFAEGSVVGSCTNTMTWTGGSLPEIGTAE
ncbi:heavy-metal-associated domain-containing protein [Methanimicrococcus stummii]|nr:heavy-metal-associated domain-containing protein [Methanimicrococcus sp. Es2]